MTGAGGRVGEGVAADGTPVVGLGRLRGIGLGRWVVLAVACSAGVVGSWLSSEAVREAEVARAKLEFDRAAAELEIAVAQTCERAMSAIRGAGALFDLSREQRAEDLREYLRPMRPWLLALDGVMWAPRVGGGFPVAFTESSDMVSGAVVCAQGFDLASVPAVRALIDQAVDTGRKLASPGVELPTAEGDRRACVVVVAPVYTTRAGGTSVEARRDALAGVVVGTFRPEQLVAAALEYMDPGEIRVQLLDAGPAPGIEDGSDSILRPRVMGGVLADGAKLTSVAELVASGWMWKISCEADAGYITARTTAMPLVLLAAGLGVTGIVGVGLFRDAWRSEEVLRLRAARVAELGELNRSLVAEATTRRRAETIAWRREALYRAASEGSFDAFYILTAVQEADGSISDFVFHDVNGRGAQLIGLAKEQIVGQRLCELIPVNRTGGFFERYVAVYREQRPMEEEFWISELGTEGRRRLRHQVVPLPDGVAITTRDVTEAHEAAEKLEGLNRQLADRNRELEQFTYTVSHDLKSPIVTISGMLGFLKRDLKAERADRIEDILATIDATTVKMRETIDDLLELSRVGRAAGVSQPVVLETLVRGVVESHSAELMEKGIRVSVLGGLGVAMGDRRQIGLLVDNLLTNAIKYGCDPSRPPAGRAQIEIGGVTEGEEARLFVRDFGPGIEPKYHEKVFGLFQRLVTVKEGTGVGLTIARRIAEVNRGRVWVQSPSGRAGEAGGESDESGGATFWVSLPAVPVEGAAGVAMSGAAPDVGERVAPG